MIIIDCISGLLFLILLSLAIYICVLLIITLLKEFIHDVINIMRIKKHTTRGLR